MVGQMHPVRDVDVQPSFSFGENANESLSLPFGFPSPAGDPVAALLVHRTDIHYRDCASLTLYTREPLRNGLPQPVCTLVSQ